MSNDNSKELLELSKKTTRIDKLINKNNSGKNAWEAGKLLYEIKENKEYKAKEYKNFGVYTNNDLRISETKAVNYINIYLLYDDENISSLILVTHLTYLAKQDHDIRDAVLEILKDEDQKTIAGFKKLSKKPKASLFGNEEKNIEKEEKMQIRPDYDKDIIIGTTNLLEAAKNSAQEVTPILAKEAFDIVNETNRRDFSATKLPNVIGELLKSSHFPEIENLYKSEPTNEMGLVALFCTMFHLLKGKKIEFKLGNKFLKFNTINYVREEFPDAEVEFLVQGNKPKSVLKIEFEFKSSNYLSHEHNISDKECHLIIAWESNLTNKQVEKFGKVLPPIISIKDLLQSGEIKLF